MIEVGGIPFTIAIATVVALFYLLYSVLFKKQAAAVESPQSNGDENSESI